MSVFKKHLIDSQIHNSLAGEEFKATKFVDGDLIIAVMDRGWVFVGFATILPEGEVRLDCAHNIHRWGTTKGLGEIAVGGPTKETILYEAGIVYGKPILVMKADINKW
jgi:hypothetical protein